MIATCDSCGESFDAQRKTARFCGPTCRSRAHRAPTSAPAPFTPLEPRGSLAAAVRRELEAAERVDSALGAQALVLAERIDANRSDTGSAVASLSKELRAVMDAALADAPKAADELDELAARRRRKASGA